MAPSTAVLSAESLISYIASSLPRDASPQLKSPTDAIAIACHAGMLAVGFRLVGLGEDHTLEAHSQQLPQDWNASTAPAFRYKHPQSSMEYLLNISRLGNKTVIQGMGLGDDKPVNFNLTTSDFISTSSLPAAPCSASTATQDTKASITQIYITPSRLTDLGTDLRVNIIQRLIPNLQKEGYEETQSSSSASTTQASRPRDPASERDPPGYDPLRAEDPPARPHPLADPSVMPRRPPVPMGDFPPPGFEDEHQMLPQRHWPPGGGVAMPGYGERDLYPAGMGPNDPLRIGGVRHPGIRGGPGGGMHPTFDDPMFGGGGGSGGDFGFDPQAPPGARYDPVGPGDGRPMGGAGGRRFGPRGFGGPGGGFGAPHNPFGGFGGGDFI